jgi:hypothetical protein
MTSRPNPQSQSFSRGYGSILPTSLTYIILWTRGCTPWRPEAVMSTTRGVNNSLHWVFKDCRERTRQCKRYTAFPDNSPYRRSIRFQGQYYCEKEKKTLSGILANVLNFVYVTIQYPRPGSGLLTWFPFDNRHHPKKVYFQIEFSYLLGSTHPCPITVHMEPFSTSVFKVLIGIFATATKICTRIRFTSTYVESFATNSTPPYSTWSHISHVG